MEFNCSCCGHVGDIAGCECPNAPGPQDPCHPRYRYKCIRCGRYYLLPHAKGLKLESEKCTGKECPGTLIKIVISARYPNW